jgi:copper(I)-binding protein
VRNKNSVGCGVGVLLLTLLGWTAHAADIAIGPLVLTHPWSRPTPPVASTGVVYLSITNRGLKLDRLTAQSTPIAGSVEIHESRMVKGVMEMRHVPTVDCPPRTTVEIQPGGLHLMLIGLKRPLVAGMDFPLQLHFQEAGTVTVQVHVSEPE